MTDLELLELAAKAAGLPELRGAGSQHNGYYVLYEQPTKWNPLDDDGDAFRLAVDCGIDIRLPGAACQAATQDARLCCSELYGDDPYAATRRAIVRAAAEIGRAMG